MKIKYAFFTLVISSTLLACSATTANSYNANQRSTNQQLNSADASTLTFMREEEKIARDVYISLYQHWENNVFNKISGSEQRHMDAMARQLQLNNLPDPVVNNSVGVFTNSKLAGLYQDLMRKGQQSEQTALHVAAYIEELDIQDLQKAIAQSRNSALNATYERLMRGSRNHLRAFVRQIERQGVHYQAQLMPQSEVNSIINSAQERGNKRGNKRGNGRGNQGQGHGMGHGGRGNGMGRGGRAW